MSEPIRFADYEHGCSLVIPDRQTPERSERLRRFVAEHWGEIPASGPDRHQGVAMLTEVIRKAISEYYKGMAEVPNIQGCAAHVAAEVERSKRPAKDIHMAGRDT